MLSDRERRAAQELEADLLADEAFARAVQPATRHLASPAAPVVVGLGPDGDFAAVEWAAAEAAARGCRPLPNVDRDQAASASRIAAESSAGENLAI